MRRVLSCAGGWRLPLEGRWVDGTLHDALDGRAWFARDDDDAESCSSSSSSSPLKANTGTRVSCTSLAPLAFAPPLRQTPAPLRRLVAPDEPCSDTTGDEEEEEETGSLTPARCREARSAVDAAVAQGEREEVLRRARLAELRPESVTPAEVGHPTTPSQPTPPQEQPDVHSLIEAVRRAGCPMRSTALHALGLTTRALRAECRDVVRVLPGWYVHYRAVADEAQARAVLADIRRRYNRLAWQSTMRRLVVRPMLGTDGVLQNLPGWLHARVALRYMLRRNGCATTDFDVPDELARAVDDLVVEEE